MFSGYLFVETDIPEKFYEALKEIPKAALMLSVDDKEGKSFIPLHKEEEIFFDSVLSDGLMKVSYIHMNKNRRIDMVIGPLQSYQDNILRIDIPHRRAIVDIPMLGESKRLKFGLWLDMDPKLAWIEEEKKERGRENANGENMDISPWDWKAWKKLNKDKKQVVDRNVDDNIYGYKIGDRVINTTGIYGDTLLEIAEINSNKGTVVVNVPIFGTLTKVEMSMEEIE